MHLIPRRHFLQQVTAVAALSSAFPYKAFAATGPVRPIGIQLYTVDADLQKDVSGTLKKVRAIGYTEVESSSLAGLTAKQFRTALDDAGLHCHSAHLHFDAPDLSPVFDDATTIGAHYVVSSGLFSDKPGTQPNLDSYHAMAERLNAIGRKAKQASLQYTYHNHNFEFQALEGGKIGYDVLLKETDPDLVKFELDCGWMVSAGYRPEVYFKAYPDRYKMLHIKDFVTGSKISTSLAKGLRPQGTELGRGHIDYKPILDAAARIGIDYYFVEQEPPFPDMTALEAAKVDYDYLHPLLS